MCMCIEIKPMIWTYIVPQGSPTVGNQSHARKFRQRTLDTAAGPPDRPFPSFSLLPRPALLILGVAVGVEGKAHCRN